LQDMPLLPTLADRVWFAYNCLPRDAKGNPPSYVSLERPLKLPNGTFSRLISRTREDPRGTTLDAIAKTLHLSLDWLLHGGDDGPVPTGIVPPRPGTIWICHGELRGWPEAVATNLRLQRPRCPPQAFRAGADMPVYRPVDQVTPELALAAAIYAWETSTPAEQRRYSDIEAKAIASKERPSGKQKAV
jgi:hypothetical protein